MRAAGIAGVLSGFATLAIVLLPQLYAAPAGMADRIVLVQNPWFQLRQWMSFLNVFAILIAASGLAVHGFPRSPGASSTALLLLLF